MKSLVPETSALVDMTEEWCAKFIDYLFKRGQSTNTIGTKITKIKAVVHGLPEKWQQLCPMLACPKPNEKTTHIYLNEDELQRIADVNLQGREGLDTVRDHFLIMAWTGCRYSDLAKVTKVNMVKHDGQDCFDIEQEKTAEPVTLPILPPIVPVLEKYNYQPPAPFSNAYFNDLIKRVCLLAGIVGNVTLTHTRITPTGATRRVSKSSPRRELVTAHTARRSFATNMYLRGYPVAEIMKITGHTTEKSFMAYIKITKKEAAVHMAKTFQVKTGEERIA